MNDRDYRILFLLIGGISIGLAFGWAVGIGTFFIAWGVAPYTT